MQKFEEAFWVIQKKFFLKNVMDYENPHPQIYIWSFDIVRKLETEETFSSIFLLKYRVTTAVLSPWLS